MIVLSVTGLVLDLVGVMMLGVDLVRIQKRLRGDAEGRLAALNDIAEGAGGPKLSLRASPGISVSITAARGATYRRTAPSITSPRSKALMS
jgi:hypothetical protein